MVSRFLQHVLQIGPQHVQEEVGWCWRQGFDFGTFLLLVGERVVGRLHGCPQWLTIQCDENRFLPSPLDPPALRPLPPVHYPGKSSMNKVFSALILALAYGYEVMLPQLLKVCMPCYCRQCDPALSYPTNPSAPCTPSPLNTPYIPVRQTCLCLH